MQFFQYALYQIPALVIALCFHEFGHGLVAYWCGDPTAKNAGRLTLNPMHHLDLKGSLCLFFLGFGWAKPVPINPYNFKNKRWDDLKVSLAGITINFILYLLFTFLQVGIENYTYTVGVVTDLQYNILLIIHTFSWISAQLNLSLAIFNLFPIPPLDGYHVVNDLFFKGRWRITQQQAGMGMGLLVLLSYLGVTGDVINTIMDYVEVFVKNLMM